jgi:endonuclease III
MPDEPAPTAKPAAKPAKSAAKPTKSAVPAKVAAKPANSAAKPKPKPKPKPKRKPRNPEAEARAWAKQLAKKRPGLVPFVLDGLAAEYSRPSWEPRLDPTSELVLTILTANSADINAEVAYARLRERWPSAPTPDGASGEPRVMPGWGGIGIPDLPDPDWAAVEAADLAELTDVIRPGGLANQKAPRVQAALRAISGGTGGYSLEFLRDRPALEARDWLAAIPGIGKKTASVVLLFSFGMPLMPVDRHVFRVAERVGLLPPKTDADGAHDVFLALLESDQMYEGHVSLITHGRRMCHAQKPECARCPLSARCRFVNPKAE